MHTFQLEATVNFECPKSSYFYQICFKYRKQEFKETRI